MKKKSQKKRGEGEKKKSHVTDKKRKERGKEKKKKTEKEKELVLVIARVLPPHTSHTMQSRAPCPPFDTMITTPTAHHKTHAPKRHSPTPHTQSAPGRHTTPPNGHVWWHQTAKRAQVVAKAGLGEAMEDGAGSNSYKPRLLSSLRR